MTPIPTVCAARSPVRRTTDWYGDLPLPDVSRGYPVLEQMQKIETPLLSHGAVTHCAIDIFYREKMFIDSVLALLQSNFSSLNVRWFCAAI